MSTRSLKSNLKWLLGGRLFNGIISAIISIYVIRKLEVSDFGIYNLFLGSFSFFALFSTSGVITAARRFIPEFLEKRNYSYLVKIIKLFYSYSILISIILIVLVFIFKESVGSLLNIPKFSEYYTIFSINIFLFLQVSLSGTVAISFYDQKIVTSINVLAPVIRGALYLVFFDVLNLRLIFIIEAIVLFCKLVPFYINIFSKIKKIRYNKDEINTDEDSD